MALDPARIIFNGPLIANFRASQPIVISAEQVVLDFEIVVGRAPVSVQWYPEYCSEYPYDTATRWFRETAEEDIGNGDVRMPFTIRRFTVQGADNPLPTGTYRFTVQLKRAHMFCRIQIAGVGATALVYSTLNDIPIAATA